MQRLVIVVLGLTLCSVPAWAGPVEGTGPAPRPLNLSANAAGLVDAGLPSPASRLALEVRTTRSRAATSQASAPKRSFWKSPWPYVIVGGAVVAVVLIADKSSEGGIY